MTKDLNRQNDIPQAIKGVTRASLGKIVAMLSWDVRASKRFAYEVTIMFKTDQKGSFWRDMVLELNSKQ